jgi:hypothetical protein
VTAEFWCGKEGGPAKSSAEVVSKKDEELARRSEGKVMKKHGKNVLSDPTS